MNLEQARQISALSTAPSDKCTWFLNLGFSPFCTMHDHLLQHFVYFTDRLNQAQRAYMYEQGLDDYIILSDFGDTSAVTFTRKDADHLFREELNEKLLYSGKDINLDKYKWYSKIVIKLVHIFPRKVWYWFWRNIYYFGVATWRRIKR